MGLPMYVSHHQAYPIRHVQSLLPIFVPPLTHALLSLAKTGLGSEQLETAALTPPLVNKDDNVNVIMTRTSTDSGKKMKDATKVATSIQDGGRLHLKHSNLGLEDSHVWSQ